MGCSLCAALPCSLPLGCFGLDLGPARMWPCCRSQPERPLSLSKLGNWKPDAMTDKLSDWVAEQSTLQLDFTRKYVSSPGSMYPASSGPR